MQGTYHGESELIVEQPKRIEKRPETTLDVHVFGLMQRDEKEFTTFQAQLFLSVGHLAATFSRCFMVDHLLDRVAGDIDAIARKALGQQILATPIRVGHQHRT